MPTIPIYEQQVGVQATAAPTEKVQPMGPEASGVNIGEAVAGLGKAVEHVGSEFAQTEIYKQRIQAMQDEADIMNGFGQEALGLVDDAKSKLGDAAKGITWGTLAQGRDPQSGQPTSQYHPAVPLGYKGDVPAGIIRPEESVSFKLDQLKQKYLENVSPYVAAHISRRLDSMRLGFLKSVDAHERQQYNVAFQKSSDEALNTLKISASSFQGVDDLNNGIKSYLAVLQNAAVHAGADPQNVKLAQNAIDTMTAAAVNENLDKDPKKAQAFLESHETSPEIRKGLERQVDGKMSKLTADERFAEWTRHDTAGSPVHSEMLNKDGSINEGKLPEEAAKIYPSDQLKQDNFVHLVMEKDANAKRMLDSQNKAQDNTFYSEVNKPNVDIDQMNLLAHQYAAKLRNGQTDFADLNAKLAYNKQVNNPRKAASDLNTYATVVEKMTNGEIDKPGQLLQYKDHLSDSDLKHFTGQLLEGKSEAFTTMKKEVISKINDGKEGIPYADRPAFIKLLDQQAKEQNVGSDSAKFGELYQKLKTSFPTGEKGWFGSEKGQEYYKTVESLQKNLPLVKQAGGADQAYEISKALGGPQIFEPDSDGAKVLSGMLSHGWTAPKIIAHPEIFHQTLERNTVKGEAKPVEAALGN